MVYMIRAFVASAALLAPASVLAQALELAPANPQPEVGSLAPGLAGWLLATSLPTVGYAVFGLETSYENSIAREMGTGPRREARGTSGRSCL